jgi:hypothetical protein
VRGEATRKARRRTAGLPGERERYPLASSTLATLGERDGGRDRTTFGERRMNKDTARSRLRDAVRFGRIEKPNRCEACGEITIPRLLGGHHFEGYEKWWSVKWLCVRCHNKVDRDLIRMAGESNGASKLTRETVATAKELRALGLTFEAIADRFGVSYSTLRSAVSGKTWI